MKFAPKVQEDKDDLDTGVNLASCFNGYEKLETLSGNDQWYCRNCKEHRDITKKLEIYKVPKIMILQLKRFSSKASNSNSSKSEYMNMAYA